MRRLKQPAVWVGLLALGLQQNVKGQEYLRANKTETPPKLDGVAGDAVWQDAREYKIQAEGRGGATKGKKVNIALKAAHDGENFYLLFRWEDSTKNESHRSYVWNEAKNAYAEGPDREDACALSCAIRGIFSANMLSGLDDYWDVWQWMAKRSAPSGYARDMTFSFSQKEPEGEATRYETKRGDTLWIAHKEDAGDSVRKVNPAPGSKQASTPPHYEPNKPSGSAADVRAGSAHQDGWWTVELARKLDTGQKDDVQFFAPGSITVALSVFDAAEDDEHYTTAPFEIRMR